jgi:hypothetical protein
MTLEELLKLPDAEPERELVDGSGLPGFELAVPALFAGWDRSIMISCATSSPDRLFYIEGLYA